VCYQRGGSEPVPGCEGTGTSGTDYCLEPPVLHGDSYDYCSSSQVCGRCAGETAHLESPCCVVLKYVVLWASSFCPTFRVCIHRNLFSDASGDCDSHRECAGDLVCFSRSGTEPVPGCSGKGISGYGYCIVVSTSSISGSKESLSIIAAIGVASLAIIAGACF